MTKYSEMSEDEKREYNRLAQVKYREKNHDLILERRRKNYQDNIEEERIKRVEKYDPEYARKYYLANRVEILARTKAYNQANPELKRKSSRAWYEANTERKSALDKKWRDANKSGITAKRHAREWKLKHEVWAQYGGAKCACCGAAEQEFLTVDHVNGGGGKHRKEIRENGSHNIYTWLKKHKYPDKHEYRVLCMNCNWAFGMYGRCPHHPTETNEGESPCN